jgi:hypothetical protein
MTSAIAAVVELRPARVETLTPRLELSDGSSAERAGDAIELKAPDGSLILRFEPGKMIISPARGDLELAAPAGRVVLRAAMDVAVEAGRDVTHKAGRKLSLHAKDLDATARTARLVAADAGIVARRLATTAETIITRCDELELQSVRIVQRAKETVREVEGLAEDRLGRARTLVRDLYSLATRATSMTSEEETAIDGSKILLG